MDHEHLENLSGHSYHTGKNSISLSLPAAVAGFAAVGSQPRLEVLLTLVRAGPAGLSVGEIQSRLNIPPSTLAHHLKFLSDAGLLVQEREGRTTQNRAAFEHIEALAGYLLNECCAEVEGHSE